MGLIEEYLRSLQTESPSKMELFCRDIIHVEMGPHMYVQKSKTGKPKKSAYFHIFLPSGIFKVYFYIYDGYLSPYRYGMFANLNTRPTRPLNLLFLSSCTIPAYAYLSESEDSEWIEINSPMDCLSANKLKRYKVLCAERNLNYQDVDNWYSCCTAIPIVWRKNQWVQLTAYLEEPLRRTDEILLYN